VAGKTRKPGADPTIAAGRELVMTRVFDAPRARVWAAWTDPGQIVKWWGPHGFTLTIDEMDVRPGGVWKSTMHGPDGTEYLNDCVFTEVVKLERIAYELTAGRKHDRGTQEPMEVSWTFEAQGEATKVTVRMRFPTPEARDRFTREYEAVKGGEETLDRLREHLAGEVRV
jgi:uncharacterized protein YndB with AHSA1/START domain